MKTQLQQIREILDAARYPVDPAHEADFKALLLNDKRRRRGVLWFFLGGIVILLGSYSLFSLNEDVQQQEKTIQQQSVPQVNPADSETLARMESVSSRTSTLANNAVVEEVVKNSEANSPAGENTLSTIDAKEPQANAHAITLNTKSTNHSSTPTQNRRSIEYSTATIVTASNGQSSAKSPEQEIGKKEVVNLDRSLDIAALAQSTSHLSASEERSEYSSELLQVPVSRLSNVQRELVSLPTIIPAGRINRGHRFNYGITGSIFPVGRLFSQTTLQTGYGFDIGAYSTLNLNSRIQLRADAGFSKMDGGIEYLKNSVTEKYSFVFLQESHSLDIKELYSGYASTEIGFKSGKSVFCLGLHGQYIYGARGNIEDVQYSQEASTPVVTNSNDIWLNTEDMPKLSVRGLLGIRSKLTRRLEFGAFVHIPILHTVRTPKASEVYDYQVYSHSLLPQFKLSYQINAR